MATWGPSGAAMESACACQKGQLEVEADAETEAKQKWKQKQKQQDTGNAVVRGTKDGCWDEDEVGSGQGWAAGTCE